MPAFNFNKAFAYQLADGSKISTIRKTKRGSVGQTAYLFIGQRTAKCRRVGASKLVQVRPVQMYLDINDRFCVDITSPTSGCSVQLGQDSMELLAREEGFVNPSAMRDWFEANLGLPFNGWQHVWEPLQ